MNLSSIQGCYRLLHKLRFLDRSFIEIVLYLFSCIVVLQLYNSAPAGFIHFHLIDLVSENFREKSENEFSLVGVLSENLLGSA